LEDGIEALDVADLDEAMFLVGQPDQFARCGQVIGHGLLNQHMTAKFDQTLRDGVVRRGRGDDVQGVAVRGGLLHGMKRAGVKLLGVGARGLRL
jgi:hypothetical protein